MNAREDHLRIDHQFDIPTWMDKTGYAWVVKEHKIQYLRPAKVNEWVQISSAIIYQTSHDNIVEFGMWDAARRKLKSLMWSNFQYIDMAKLRPAPYHQELLDKFLPLVVEDRLPNYETRAVEMQTKFRH